MKHDKPRRGARTSISDGERLGLASSSSCVCKFQKHLLIALKYKLRFANIDLLPELDQQIRRGKHVVVEYQRVRLERQQCFESPAALIEVLNIRPAK